MQKLTLRGYLSDYVQHLSGLDTNSISKLAKEAQSNYRLREPLFLYAYCIDKVDFLLDLTKGSELGEKFLRIRSKFSFPEFLHALETRSGALDERYHKCYHSYVCKRDMSKTYNRKKQFMRTKIKELQAAKGVTTYRIYTDLKLNGANVNAFIKHGNVNKVSVDNARKMLKYLENFNY